MNISNIITQCLMFIEKRNYVSYDPFDALTNPLINAITKPSLLLRRIAIQINSKSPVDIHWLGMKKLLHTKTISDLLWYYSVGENTEQDKVNKFFLQLLSLKNKYGFGWGLNFPYTSRFINADADMPNLYNTINSGIAVCYSYHHLTDENKLSAKTAIAGITEFIETQLGYVDEGEKGWYLYYPGQKYPTYNVNALALYFLAFSLKLGVGNLELIKKRIVALCRLLCDEQNEDGSWVYSRSPKGGWVDGFHSGFVVESLAFVLKERTEIDGLQETVRKGWDYFVNKMFTEEGYPKYFAGSGRYPIEAQNCAQAIQTISNIGMWLSWHERELLERVVKISVQNLYNKKGFFYHQKTKFLTYKTPYIRWSVSPMILALEYARKYLKKDSL